MAGEHKRILMDCPIGYASGVSVAKGELVESETGQKRPALEFDILAHGFYSPDQLEITYNPSLRMPISQPIQAWMDTLWEEKLASAREQHIPLFDAPLFRFVEIEAQADGTLHLLLGDTGYKEYVTTRVPEFAQGRNREELGNALSVCSVVETSDGYVLLDKRQGVDVYVGRYHVIGGFFERDRDSTVTKQPDPFGAVRREIREETGILQSDIREQICLGVVYDTATPHAEMCFLTSLTIPSAEVHNRKPEEDEIKQLAMLKVTESELREFLLKNHGNISATGEPNLLMYGGIKFGEKWFEEMLRYLTKMSPEF
jgi:8-oxo-dGTP pyrophosphatase MutT (NUDIX family)